MEELKKVNDYFPTWLMGGGIISSLGTSVPWSADYSAIDLDILYHGARSGMKLASPLLDAIGMEQPLNEQQRQMIGEAILAKFGRNWRELWDTLNYEYNPIENYDMTESGSDSGEDTRTPNLSKHISRTPDLLHTENTTRTPGVSVTTEQTTTPDITESTSDVRTPTLTRSTTETPGVKDTEEQTRTPNLTQKVDTTGVQDTQKDSVYGFNSTTAVPSDESASTHQGTETTSNTGTETNKRTMSHEGTNTTSETETGTDTRDVTLTRTGTETVTETHTESGSESTSRTLQESGSDTEITTESGTDKTERSSTHQLTRHGNIGVTTSQQMIQSQRELWFWNFFEQVFADIDTIIACPIY